MIILAIETSCDETSAAVLENTAVLSNIISSQIEIHRRFGGVVPEIASRNHTLQIKTVIETAIAEAGLALSEIDAIAVTEGAGLLGALLVGVSYAKALAYALNVPLYAVNHIVGHVAANHISPTAMATYPPPPNGGPPPLAQGGVYGQASQIPPLAKGEGHVSGGGYVAPCPPYICLIASGGHTAVAEVTDYPGTPGAIKILGETQDDAAGEAFDKVARALGLPYPGGPEIEKLAASGEANIELPTPLKNQKGYDFSFSGIKTAVMQLLNVGAVSDRPQPNKADVAASFEELATEIMVKTAIRAVKDRDLKQLVIAGGVAANKRLRKKADGAAALNGISVFYPPLKLCTDNAAMIGAAAYFMIKAGVKPAGLDLDANAGLTLQRKL